MHKILNNKYYDIEETLKKVIRTKKKNKKVGFLIGNTSKAYKTYYLTPIREYSSILIFGVIIFKISEAKEISKLIDGKVDYVFVDSEKKIKSSSLKLNNFANIERTVKENINLSKVLTYKGNDLTVDAVDLLLSSLSDNNIRGLGGKKIAIIGAGNLGSKIAIKFLERGANVTLYRRNQKKLKLIINMINLIKPQYTRQKIKYYKNINDVTKNANFLIGATNGIPVINQNMINNSSKDLVIVDVGKGTLQKNATKLAIHKKILTFRLDITAALSGMLESHLFFDNIFKKTIGSKIYKNQKIVSGGILAEKNDFVVDNYFKPKKIYGISDGEGDLKKKLLNSDIIKIKKIKKLLRIK